MDQAADTIERPTRSDYGHAGRKASSGARRSSLYLACSFAISLATVGAIIEANRRYAPEMYRSDYMETVAEAFESGQHYAVFDLNINIRKLREEQWKRLEGKPDVVVLGASQWQEASANLMPNRHYLNGHVHRDYYEDVLGMVELLVRYDKLPKDLVITIRDRLFTPVSQRTDFLWLPTIPYFQAMAKRLSLPQHRLADTYPLQRPRELLSLPMLLNNAARWHNAKDRPFPTSRHSHAELDVLHPDGSITWSDKHHALFTQERARKLAIAHADANKNKPVMIDPRGVEAVDRLLSYLAVRGVRVHLAHPPFNPIFYDRIRDTPFMAGLRQVEAVTRELAAKHKLGLAGSFDPEALGCSADMFIDAEHSNARCLKNLLADVANSIDLPMVPIAADAPVATASAAYHSRQVLVASGWMANESPTPGETVDRAEAPLSAVTVNAAAVANTGDEPALPRQERADSLDVEVATRAAETEDETNGALPNKASDDDDTLSAADSANVADEGLPNSSMASASSTKSREAVTSHRAEQRKASATARRHARHRSGKPHRVQPRAASATGQIWPGDSAPRRR
ncbi:MAG: hypothetical protein R3D44_09545 [Hyphomicrobiaceae bacterium]